MANSNIKKLLIKTALWALPIVILLVAVEVKLHFSPFISTYSAKQYNLNNQTAKVEVLVLGSSQTLNAINPEFLDATGFNMANVSQTIFYDEQLTLKYLSQLPKLKTIIIGISYFSFFYELEDIEEAWRTHYYYQHYSIKGNNFSYTNANNFSLLKLYGAKKSIQLLVNNSTSGDVKKLMPNGCLLKTEYELINDSLAKQRVAIHNKENFGRRLQIEKRLEQFLLLLKNKKLNVVFVTTPCHNSYRKFCDKQIVEKNEVFIQQLCKKYDCTYLNFFADTTFTDEDFANCDHLINSGAKKFSLLLNQQLKLLQY